MSEVKKVSLLLLFVSYFTKSLILTSTWVDALVLLILGGFYCFSEYKASDKELKAVKNQLVEQEKVIQELKNKVDSIKFVQHVKPQGLGIK